MTSDQKLRLGLLAVAVLTVPIIIFVTGDSEPDPVLKRQQDAEFDQRTYDSLQHIRDAQRHDRYLKGE